MAEIVFTVDKNNYYPGESIDGFVTVILSFEMKIKDIKLKCEGFATTRWKENCGTFEAQATETHFKESVFLLPSQIDGCTLDAGSYKYPFSFQLPFRGLPFSFTSEHGSIEYHLRTTIRQGLFSKNIQETFVFTVKEIVDLNKIDPIHQKQTEIRQHKDISSLFGLRRSGSIGLTFSLPKTAFVPGECLNFQAAITNNTNQILFTSAIIEQEIRYTGQNKRGVKHRKYCYNKVLETLGEAVSAGEKKSWIATNNVDYQLAHTIPTVSCDIIKISYVALIKIELPTGEHLKGSIPIIIGTIPFENEIEDLLSPGDKRKIESQYFQGKKSQKGAGERDSRVSPHEGDFPGYENLVDENHKKYLY